MCIYIYITWLFHNHKWKCIKLQEINWSKGVGTMYFTPHIYIFKMQLPQTKLFSWSKVIQQVWEEQECSAAVPLQYFQAIFTACFKESYCAPKACVVCKVQFQRRLQSLLAGPVFGPRLSNMTCLFPTRENSHNRITDVYTFFMQQHHLSSLTLLIEEIWFIIYNEKKTPCSKSVSFYMSNYREMYLKG